MLSAAKKLFKRKQLLCLHDPLRLLIFTKSLRNPYPTFTFLYYLYLFVNETHGSRSARYYCAHDAMTFMTLKL